MIACHFCTSFYAEPLALHNSERGRGEGRQEEEGKGREERDKAVSAKERNKGINTMQWLAREDVLPRITNYQ